MLQKKGLKHKSITKPKKSDKVLLEKDKIKQLEDEIIYLNRKLKLETGKKETLKSLLDLLKWTDKFQDEDMKEIIKILEKYKEKVYFVKSKKEIKEILKRKLF